MRNPPQLHAHWQAQHTILNLRCDLTTPGVRDTMSCTLGLALPEQPNATVHDERLRILWIGPDEWQVLSRKHDAHALESCLRAALPKAHMAITDVSSNYHILHLTGAPVREILASGCPLDLHPRAFKPGDCAGSHYFKAAIWLWQSENQAFELLIRRSFSGYVWLMLERASAECQLITK